MLQSMIKINVSAYKIKLIFTIEIHLKKNEVLMLKFVFESQSFGTFQGLVIMSKNRIQEVLYTMVFGTKKKPSFIEIRPIRGVFMV